MTKGISPSPETRRKLSIALKGYACNFMMGTMNPAKRPEVRAKMSDKAHQRWQRWREELPIKLCQICNQVATWKHMPDSYQYNNYSIAKSNGLVWNYYCDTHMPEVVTLSHTCKCGQLKYRRHPQVIAKARKVYRSKPEYRKRISQ